MEKRNELQEKITKAIIDNNFNGVISVSPRSGKTKSVIDAINQIEKCNIVVTAPYNAILEGWKEECEKWRCEYSLYTVSFKSIGVFQNTPNYSIDLLIIDECQELSENQLTNIKSLKIPHILLLSGTIGEKSYKKLSELKRKTIYTYSIEQAIEDGIVNDYEITLHPVKLDNKDKYIEGGNKTNKFMVTEESNYNYLSATFEKWKKASWNNPKLNSVKMQWSGKRANAIYNYRSKVNAVKEFIKDKDNYILFTARTEVCDEFGNSFHSKSEEDNLTKFKNQELPYVSVVNMASMGISLPHCNTVIVHQFNSDEELAVQKIMRACMKEGKTEKTKVHIFYYKNTKDEEWLESALNGLNKNKIKVCV